MPEEADGKLRDAEWAKVESVLQLALVQAIERSVWPVYLFGPSGRGKSCAAAAIYKAWPTTARWMDFSEIVSAFTRRMDGGFVRWPHGRDMTERVAMQFLRDADLTAFDEIGSRPPTDAQLDAALHIINTRAGKPTIYTGNHDPGTLEKIWDARIAGRVCAGTVIEVRGSNRRVGQAEFVRA